MAGMAIAIPGILMFQDPATHCHQIRRHTLTLYLITGDMKQLRMSTFKAKMCTLQNDKIFQLKSILCLSVFNE